MEDFLTVENVDSTSTDNSGNEETLAVTDTGTEVTDTGTEVTDAGAEVTDTDAEVTDTDAEVTDTGAEVTDTGAEVTDTGAEVTDTGAEVTDTGAEVTDTGAEVTDSLYTGDTNTTPESEVSDSVFYDTTNQDNSVAAPSGGNVINVDNDFGGDLQSAIAAANNGDVVELGNNTYSASGVTIDKDITINGQEGSVIDGGGASDAILNLTPDASGATIQNVEITNANNGIYGFGASNLTLENLDINNIGVSQPTRDGENNTGITLNRADGVQILNSNISNVSRKGIGIGDTQGGTISGVTVQGVNLDAQHAQNHDAAGVKFFNTTDVAVRDSNFSDINAHSIWNDTTTGTTIENNTVQDVGSDFIAPGFNSEVGSIYGIYNEKSANSSVSNNNINAIDGFTAYNATEFTTQTQDLGTNNFSSQELGTTDFYANEQAETLVATTENPTEANFALFSADYYATAII
jgi:hypothetical protein